MQIRDKLPLKNANHRFFLIIKDKKSTNKPQQKSQILYVKLLHLSDNAP